MNNKIALNSNFTEGGLYKLADNITTLKNVLHNKCVKKDIFTSTSQMASEVYPYSFIMAFDVEDVNAYTITATISLNGFIDIGEESTRYQLSTNVFYSNTYDEYSIIGEYFHNNKKYFVAPFNKGFEFSSEITNDFFNFSLTNFSTENGSSFKITIKDSNDDRELAIFYATRNEDENRFDITPDEMNTNQTIGISDISGKTINVKITNY